MTVYKLENKYFSDPANEISKCFLIGFFDSMKIINSVISNYKQLPGFCDHIKDFIVTEYTVQSRTKYVYHVVHEYYLEEENLDMVTEIGVFYSKKAAQESIFELRKNNDELCRIDDSGFDIAKHRINDSYWGEGYTPW